MYANNSVYVYIYISILCAISSFYTLLVDTLYIYIYYSIYSSFFFTLLVVVVVFF